MPPSQISEGGGIVPVCDQNIGIFPALGQGYRGFFTGKVTHHQHLLGIGITAVSRNVLVFLHQEFNLAFGDNFHLLTQLNQLLVESTDRSLIIQLTPSMPEMAVKSL